MGYGEPVARTTVFVVRVFSSHVISIAQPIMLSGSEGSLSVTNRRPQNRRSALRTCHVPGLTRTCKIRRSFGLGTVLRRTVAARSLLLGGLRAARLFPIPLRGGRR